MGFKIGFESELHPAELAVINNGLREALPLGMSPVESFNFVVRDDLEKMTAAATGSLMFGSIYTSLLWVSVPLRSQGWGRLLMEAVENHGRTKRCNFATVNTFSFQALPFYLRLGYEIEFERKGYRDGAINYFLRKELLV